MDSKSNYTNVNSQMNMSNSNSKKSSLNLGLKDSLSKDKLNSSTKSLNLPMIKTLFENFYLSKYKTALDNIKHSDKLESKLTF